jgi:hypothetical protein
MTKRNNSKQKVSLSLIYALAEQNSAKVSTEFGMVGVPCWLTLIIGFRFIGLIIALVF